MTDLFTRIQVLARSALAWLTLLSAVLVALAQQLEGVHGVPEWVTRTLATVIPVLGVIIVQVRSVTPVEPDQRGLLPPQGPAVATTDAPKVKDVGLGLVELLVGGAVLILLAWLLFRRG